MLMDPRLSLSSWFSFEKGSSLKNKVCLWLSKHKETGQLLNILLVLVKLCRIRSLHSSCCQELDTHMKRDEQEQNTPGALLMENISSVLGSASRDLDTGRNAVSFGICGDKEQGFNQHGLLSYPAAAPVDFSSSEPTLHRGSGGYVERDGKVARNIVMTPRKQTLRYACRRLTGACSQNHTCEGVRKAGQTKEEIGL